MLFPQLPRKTHNFGKNRAFLGKNKWPTRSVGKNKEKSQNINKKARKRPYFAANFSPHFPRKTKVFGKKSGVLGKNRGIIGKNPMFLGKMVI